MNSPSPREPDSSPVPKIALRMMIAILLTMALLSLYSNVQRWRREKVENVIVTPAASPSPIAP